MELTSLLSLAHIRLMDAYAKIREREDGQGMTEYAVVLGVVVLLGAGIAVIISTALGTKFTSIFNSF